MATTNIGLNTQAHGSFVDTWDTPLNDNAGIIDACFGSTTTKSLSSSNVTLTATEAQAAIIQLTGTLTANVSVNVSAAIKSWFIDNQTTGAFVVTITGGSGNVVGVPQGEVSQVVWSGTNCKFVNLGRVGSYLDYAGTAVPAWVTACTVPPLLYCNGGTFSAGTYPRLNTILGGTTLPDFRGRAGFFMDDGTSRITTAGSGIDGSTILSAGGAQSVTLDDTQIPSHTHTFTGSPLAPHDHTYSYYIGVRSGAASSSDFLTTATSGTTSSVSAGTPSGTNSNTGGGLAHTNMPPAIMSGIRMIYAA